MESTEALSFSNNIKTNYPWYCLRTILQNDLNSLKEQWCFRYTDLKWLTW